MLLKSAFAFLWNTVIFYVPTLLTYPAIEFWLVQKGDSDWNSFIT